MVNPRPAASAEAAPRRGAPNFVITSPMTRLGRSQCTRKCQLATPNIDSLARDGAMFERFFVCPVCAPTRAEFLTVASLAGRRPRRYHGQGDGPR